MNESFRCTECGAPIPGDAPQGLCPNCVLAAGFPTDGRPLADLESGTGRTRGTSFVPPKPEELAPYFPDLEILALLGRGGMGVVYKARQKRLDRLVALKILNPTIAPDPAFAERFVREARALAILSHPNIVAVHDFGQASVPPELLNRTPEQNEGGSADVDSRSSEAERPAQCPLYYFIMEFVDGVNLRRLLDTERILPEQALGIVPQICGALQSAHDHGIVHRDIKPENILLDKQGRVKIADFGIAKLVGSRTAETTGNAAAQESPIPNPETLTAADRVIGTPRYMAPEQIDRPQDVDHRADIYSLGVVFYQMLTGELPAGDVTPPSKRVEVDVRLDEVVLRAMEKDPERRYQQVSEVKTRVEDIAATSGGSSESAVRTAESDGLPKVSMCYISTPEHLRSFRGRFIWIYKAKGELRLDSETLSFTSGWQTVVIPLSSIRRIAQGDYPYSAKPFPIHYIEITFVDRDVERTLLFTPVHRAIMLPDAANRVVADWLSALREAVRVRTGSMLPVELSEIPQDTYWLAKTMLAVVGFTFLFAMIPFVLYRQLPDDLSTRTTNSLIAIAVISVLGAILGWRRRSAFIIGKRDSFVSGDTAGPSDRPAGSKGDWRAWVMGVGVRNGKKVVNWPGVIGGWPIVFAVCCLFWLLQPVREAHLLTFLLFAVASTAVVAFSIWVLWQRSVEQLPVLRERETRPALAPGEGDSADRKRGINALLLSLSAVPASLAADLMTDGDWMMGVVGFVGIVLAAIWLGVHSWKTRVGKAAVVLSAVLLSVYGPLVICWSVDAAGRPLLMHAVNGNREDSGGRVFLPAKVAGSTDSRAFAEPPKLRFLAWQDEQEEWSKGRVWHSDGTRVPDNGELELLRRVPPEILGVPEGPHEVWENPRFLNLWFSHPNIDKKSYHRIELFDSEGKSVPVHRLGLVSSKPYPPNPNTGDLGWIVCTLSPGSKGKTPETATIRLYYTAGPWSEGPPIRPDYEGELDFPGGATLFDIGENGFHKAFISILTNANAVMHPTVQLDFTATIESGRKMEHSTLMSGTGGRPSEITQERQFDVPLEIVKEFRSRWRRVREVEFKDVSLGGGP